jgi:hypothetical protein
MMSNEKQSMIDMFFFMTIPSLKLTSLRMLKFSIDKHEYYLQDFYPHLQFFTMGVPNLE